MAVGKSESAFWSCKSDHKIVKLKVMIPICLDNQKKKKNICFQNLYQNTELIGSKLIRLHSKTSKTRLVSCRLTKKHYVDLVLVQTLLLLFQHWTYIVKKGSIILTLNQYVYVERSILNYNIQCCDSKSLLKLTFNLSCLTMYLMVHTFSLTLSLSLSLSLSSSLPPSQPPSLPLSLPHFLTP